MPAENKTWSFANLKEAKPAVDLPEPIGFMRTVPTDIVQTSERRKDVKALLEKKLWNVATGGFMQNIMKVVFLHFIAGGLNIFSIIFLISFITQPFRSIFGVNEGNHSHHWLKGNL
eukprot:TRINITY_DN8786_c0_g2_i1.p1 TRINITY_DN8786_c0_g2~~TRINITY_DN8786_c0_g2_i1.p1  ORF type:complete len:116 (-),score=28.01 TRINITY_DN8786_c0_g2_i1:265-612(-)